MFVGTIARIKKGSLDSLEANAMLESFLLHARCLFDFIYPPTTVRSDDVIADDFFDNTATFRNKLPQSLPMSNYLKSRTGKEVAHLTYGRLSVTPTQKIWNIGEVHDQLAEAIVVFFECLTPEQRSWFTTIMSR